MAQTSKIQWTDATWNVARGCTKVDADCKFCYMYRESLNNTRYNPIQIVKTKTVFDLPLRIKEPSKIFTSSLTDFFHEEIDLFRNDAWDIIRKCPHHTFQILTKRPDRIVENLPSDFRDFNKNIWVGTSIGSQQSMYRMAELLIATTRGEGRFLNKIFLSLEPLHGPITLEHKLLKHFDWVIVGGESGNETGKYRYRPCELEWIEQIVIDCKALGVPVFVKQLGTHLSKKMKLSDRHGGNMEEFPEHLRIRQFPNE